MSARKQLNTIYIYGIFIVAIAAGIISGSWAMVLLAIPVMLVIALFDGTIRLSPDRRPQKKCRRRKRR